ncbi:bola-like protein [Nannochloropsis oceanica]
MRRAVGTILVDVSASATRRPANATVAISSLGRPLYPTTSRFRRSLASDVDGNSAESLAREERMRTLLTEHFKPTNLLIQDVSGGCGAMYNMEVESELFKGKTLVAQHRMVNQVLAKEISEMHGLSLKTRAPKKQ